MGVLLTKRFFKMLTPCVCILLLTPCMPAGELAVATREVPPFAFRDAQGNWSGITIDIWSAIMSETGWTCRYLPRTVERMLHELQAGEIDAAAAALSITSERESRLDFSHPFFNAGLGMAVRKQSGPTWRAVALRLVSWRFFRALGVLLCILLIAGLLVWWCERRRNGVQFGGGAVRGIGAGLWWSAVTMTTVGYGDKAPVTPAGRLVAMVWMFVSVVIISGVTAGITSALTVVSLETGVHGPEDLSRTTVGTIRATTSEEYLGERGIMPRLYDDLPQVLAALAAREVDAAVYDAPMLAYAIQRDYPGKLLLLPHVFERQQYGIGMQYDSPLRQRVNRVLLEMIESGAVARIIRSYLGEDYCAGF